MLEHLHCKCHICKVERHLFKTLAEAPASVRFSTLALGWPPLARFSNVSELLTDLHTRRNGDSGASLAGELISALIYVGTAVSDVELIQSVLVLAFTPAIHRTHRELCAWFRELESEDIAQQILMLFLELVTSASPTRMNSHLPIALTRTLRKNAFRWGRKGKTSRDSERSREVSRDGGAFWIRRIRNCRRSERFPRPLPADRNSFGFRTGSTHQIESGWILRKGNYSYTYGALREGSPPTRPENSATPSKGSR
jgi:hypothetical protein